MTQFKEPDFSALAYKPVTLALARTGSFLVGDRFHASYLLDCLQLVEGLGVTQLFLLAAEGKKRGLTDEKIQGMLNQPKDNIRWAKQMREENYHTINTQAFTSLWAAQESGHENVMAAMLLTNRDCAVGAAGRFAAGRYDIETWPWDEESCLEVAQKLDQKAKQAVPDGGWDACGRLAKVFDWLGVTVDVEPAAAARYNEASLVRNVIMHRYGRLSEGDIQRVPHLKEWAGKALPMTTARLGEYHQAVIDVHLAVRAGVSAKGLMT